MLGIVVELSSSQRYMVYMVCTLGVVERRHAASEVFYFFFLCHHLPRVFH